jgi:pantoate--beta-alanine ligase
MKTVRDIETLREIVQGWRQDGENVVLVPTMGNLHRGHMSLVSLAHEQAERVIVTAFVNPAQFGPNEDFENYPRTMETDRRRLSRADVDVLFAPTSEVIYPAGEVDETRVCVPQVSTILCGQFRPGHFDGVTSVVCRLLNIVQPDIAVFGQKDYQQLVIIRRMVSDLHIPVKIIAGQTLRETDGVAMSSRNQYLSDEERAQAPALFQALKDCRDRLVGGDRDYAAIEADSMKSLQEAGFSPEYFSVRKAGDLSAPVPGWRNLVIMAAARLGSARLIDNTLVEL